MNPLRMPVVLTTLALCALGACRTDSGSLRYPDAPRAAVVDDYHGRAVADPYRWLEDPDSRETRAWVAAENELTFSYLERIPARARIHARLQELWDYERTQLPVQQGGRVFLRRNDGLQNQAVLLVLEASGEERLLLDPNTLSEDGTVAMMSFVPSDDGERVAYSLSDGGSDWRTWRVLDVGTGTLLPDKVTRNKFGQLAWAPDGSGFFYSRFDRPPEGAELQARNAPPDVCFHRLGKDESHDLVVVPRPAQDGRTQYFGLSEDGHALFQIVRDVASRKNELYRIPLAPTGGGWQASGAPEPLVQGFDTRTFPIGDDGSTVWVHTDANAPRGRIVAINPLAPGREHWRELVPERAQAIQGADEVGGRLLVEYLQDARSVVCAFDRRGGELGTLELPGIGSVSGFSGDHDDTHTFFSFTSSTQPSAIYRHELASGESRLFRAGSLRFAPDDYVTEQVFYDSKDGTRVPMFLTYRRGLARNGNAPTYLYGYGGFGISLTPSFSVQNLVWMEMGGLLAIPNLRGGGEYGEAWHEAGTKLQKQNVFDDFIAAAEWLISSGWTCSERLAIGGRSNGGLLVGACMTQRPELYGAALPAVGVLDMLRYHEFTIGWAWAGDYGTSADPEQFEALLAYSPLHNLRAGERYPPTMVTTADHDDRVVPGHSFKFAAALQAAQGAPDPVLIRIETRAGHGAGKPTAMRIAEAADCWAFLVRELGME